MKEVVKKVGRPAKKEKVEEVKEVTEDRMATFGELLIGELSENDKVNHVKALCATILDILQQDMIADNEKVIKPHLYNHAVSMIVSAQLIAEKVLTFKH